MQTLPYCTCGKVCKGIAYAHQGKFLCGECWNKVLDEPSKKKAIDKTRQNN